MIERDIAVQNILNIIQTFAQKHKSKERIDQVFLSKLYTAFQLQCADKIQSEQNPPYIPFSMEVLIDLVIKIESELTPWTELFKFVNTYAELVEEIQEERNRWLNSMQLATKLDNDLSDSSKKISDQALLIEKLCKANEQLIKENQNLDEENKQLKAFTSFNSQKMMQYENCAKQAKVIVDELEKKNVDLQTADLEKEKLIKNLKQAIEDYEKRIKEMNDEKRFLMVKISGLEKTDVARMEEFKKNQIEMQKVHEEMLELSLHKLHVDKLSEKELIEVRIRLAGFESDMLLLTRELMAKENELRKLKGEKIALRS